MARKKVPRVKKSGFQQLDNAQTSRLKNGKQKKFNQPVEPFPSNNMEFSNTNNKNNYFRLGWYCYDSLDSLDNRCSDFSKEEKGDKRAKSDKNKTIVLPCLPALRLAELS